MCSCRRMHAYMRAVPAPPSHRMCAWDASQGPGPPRSALPLRCAGGVDEKEVAVMGGSHGGLLTGHLVGQHPSRFRCASLRNPVMDLSAMIHLSDIPDWCRPASSCSCMCTLALAAVQLGPLGTIGRRWGRPQGSPDRAECLHVLDSAGSCRPAIIGAAQSRGRVLSGDRGCRCYVEAWGIEVCPAHACLHACPIVDVLGCTVLAATASSRKECLAAGRLGP